MPRSRSASPATSPLTVPRVSLVAQTVATLARELALGRWRGGLPPERELCSLLQISRTTVRAALAELERRGGLRRGKRGRPEPGEGSAPPDERPSETKVCLLTPLGFERMGRFEWIWRDALRERLAGHGVGLAIHVRPNVFGARSHRRLAELVAQNPDATWLLLRSSQALQQWFEAQRVPAVVAGSRHQDVHLPGIELDLTEVVRHAVAKLTAQGHRRLAFFLEPTPAAGQRLSEETFREASQRVASAHVIHHGPSRPEFLRAFSTCLSQPDAPTGLVVDRYTHALTALTWLLGRGVRWPGPIALISREDGASLGFSVPAITSYSFDPLLYARKAARLLLNVATGAPRLGRQHRVLPQLQRRETA